MVTFTFTGKLIFDLTSMILIQVKAPPYLPSEKLKDPDATYFSETVESPVLIVVTGALAMEQALWNFVVIGIKKILFLFGHFYFFFIFQAILQKIQKVINCQLGCCPFYEQFANFAMESPPR